MKPDVVHFENRLHQEMVELWKSATGAFVDAITTPPFNYIHVDTGMSMASAIPLAEQLQMGRIVRGRIHSMQKSGPKLGYTELGTGNYNPKGTRSIAHGERLGESAYTLDFGDPVTGRGWVFEFRISVTQYYMHEALGHSKHSQAWNTLPTAQNAFAQYMKDNSGRVLKNSLSWLLRGKFASDLPRRFQRGA